MPPVERNNERIEPTPAAPPGHAQSLAREANALHSPLNQATRPETASEQQGTLDRALEHGTAALYNNNSRANESGSPAMSALEQQQLNKIHEGFDATASLYGQMTAAAGAPAGESFAPSADPEQISPGPGAAAEASLAANAYAPKAEQTDFSPGQTGTDAGLLLTADNTATGASALSTKDGVPQGAGRENGGMGDVGDSLAGPVDSQGDLQSARNRQSTENGRASLLGRVKDYFKSWRGDSQDGESSSLNSDLSPQADAASDRALDRLSSAATGDGSLPPPLSMPTPEQISSAPLDQLQAMSQNNRQSLNNYVQSQGDKIPSLAFHGTNASSGRGLTRLSQKGELWVAGQHPARQALGAHQRVGDLSVSLQTSMNYADERGKSGGSSPGPVLVYDASNQPQAWSKTSYDRTGSPFNGSSQDDKAKFGLIDLEQAKLLGSISRERLDGLKQQFAPHHEALLAKQGEILKDPGGLDPARVSDLHARAQALAEIARTHELHAALDVVARAKAEQ